MEQQQQDRLEMFGVDITPDPWPQTPLERLRRHLEQTIDSCHDRLDEARAELREALALEARETVLHVAFGVLAGLAIAGGIVGADQLAEVLR